jgi:acyl-CoA synthetase (AMP-forming)/AMP-acid ligase II
VKPHSAYDVETLHGRRATDPVNRLVVGDILERLTWSYPDKTALIAWSGACASERFSRMTYREANEAANQVGNALLAQGLRRSDRVAMLCDNSVEAVLTMLGAAKAGLVAVPLNPLFHASVTQELLHKVGATYAVVDSDLWPSAESAFAAAGLAPAVSITLSGKPVPGTTAFADWIADQSTREPEPELPLHCDDIWSMLFTSGTTSIPKAVMYSHVYTYVASMAFKGSLTRGLRFEEDLRLCTFLPVIYHCGHNAGIFPAFLSGGTCVIGRRFDPVAVADAVTTERATALWGGAPRFLGATAAAAEAAPEFALTSLTVGLFAWSAMTPDVSRRLKALCGADLLLVEAFGQTEAISCYRFWLDQFPDKVERSAGAVNHVGVPNPLLAGAVLDADGQPLTDRPGIPGEAAYRSPAVMTGYYRDEAATADAFRGGWFHSGDSCLYEPDGTQTMVDRYKDMIKTGGENVASIRVEAVASSHPEVTRAAVIGLPDEQWGERVVVVATRGEGSSLTPEELISYCRDRLAGFESPKEAVFITVMPETVGGKILKYKLREQLSRMVRSGSAAPDH